ncbi:MAG: DUF2286 domain-containing protein [Candidatus Methanomethylicia archaeon]
MKSIIILSEEGNVSIHREIESSLEEAVKEAAKEAMEKWNIKSSDFIIIRDVYPMEIPLPLSSEEYNVYSKFTIERTQQKTVIVELPVYIISFDNEWLEEGYKDHKVFIVTIEAPFREEVNNEILEWCKEMTTETIEKE